MPWIDDQTTPSYVARPALSLRAFMTPSGSAAPSTDSQPPVPRASGIVPRHPRAHAQPASWQPSAAARALPTQRSSVVASAPAARHYPPTLPQTQLTADAVPAVQTGPRLRSTILPQAENRRPVTLPSFELRQLFSDPYVWLSNPQRALLLVVLVSSTIVIALLCLGGFLTNP